MKFSAVGILCLVGLAAAVPAPAVTVDKTKTVVDVVSTVTLTKTDKSFATTVTVTHSTHTVYQYSATVTIAGTTRTVTQADPTVTVGGKCLSSAKATALVNGFASLLTAYDNNTANALLADDFTDQSDSINYLAGYPLGSLTFSSKTAFEQGQGAQPAIGFNVDSIDAITCNNIAFRWTANLGSYNIQGIEVFYCKYSSNKGWQISSVFSEFNVGAWELSIGESCGPYSPGDSP